MSAAFHSSGTHLIADLHGVDAAKLADPALIEHLLRCAALAAGATILGSHVHHFGEGGGVTGVVLLAESHITIHTWPETGFAAADIFMCGPAQPHLALAPLEQTLLPQRVEVQCVDRGGVYRNAAPAPASMRS